MKRDRIVQSMASRKRRSDKSGRSGEQSGGSDKQPGGSVGQSSHPGEQSSFHTAGALESLHTELVQLEVFAHLAAEVVTRLSPPSNRAQRRDYIRLYALVTKVADDAFAAVGRGDQLIAQLAGSLKRRQTSAD
jgi:hypothetical protein